MVTKYKKSKLDKILIDLVTKVQLSHTLYMDDRVMDDVFKTAERIQKEVIAEEPK